MKLSEIDLNKIKVAIFDFDDTLAIHENKDYLIKRNESKDKQLDYYLNAYSYYEKFYQQIEPCKRSDVLYDFIIKLRERKIKIYCLSGMKFSFHLKAKQAFVNKYYGSDIEVISAASQDLKIDGVKIIQKYNECKLEEILFIDDNKEIIESLNALGINSVLVNDIES